MGMVEGRAYARFTLSRARRRTVLTGPAPEAA